MTDHEEMADPVTADKISDTSSDSEAKETPLPPSSAEHKTYRLFGREKPVHKVLGGGKRADILLWRNKKISGGVVGVATAVWVLLEVLEYHLVSVVCHVMMISLGLLFLWSNATTLINKKPPHLPEVHIPEDGFLDFVSALRTEVNRALGSLREIGAGRDLKKFLGVVGGLWIISAVGNYCNFLTLLYISFVLLHAVPVVYEKYDDKIDAYAEKALVEVKKLYVVFKTKIPLYKKRD